MWENIIHELLTESDRGFDFDIGDSDFVSESKHDTESEHSGDESSTAVEQY